MQLPCLISLKAGWKVSRKSLGRRLKAREWSGDKMLRRLEALLVMNKDEMFLVSGSGGLLARMTMLAIGSRAYALAP